MYSAEQWIFIKKGTKGVLWLGALSEHDSKEVLISPKMMYVNEAYKNYQMFVGFADYSIKSSNILTAFMPN